MCGKSRAAGTGKEKRGNAISLTHEQVRTLVFLCRSGGFDAKLRAAGPRPSVG